MTVDEVRSAVAIIRECSADFEIAHSMEDDLFEKVLASIRDGSPNGRELAGEALKAKEIDFPRYTA